MLKYTTVEKNDFLLVSLEGDLDIEGTEVVNEELIPELVHYHSINISLEKVPFVDSSGMGLLISLVNTLKEQNVKITISDVQDDVFEVFELIQLPEILGEEVFI
ncbi:STAS domain-containing protein [Salinibacillus xinjiangensis]|uniref:Anti-sigma factor antagonist n=1 Tax=Salinibacillus xinjiangensis TaxID=1229268 RepID=A0A6G1X2B9_9BACI|nr:STAS domain-containing protein [Salinibacillus xinjiangensis]MRG85035.1 anti-sigma factor antagonist [Salinibacillus xinjiangensis]